MSELKAFNASELKAFNESELRARGLGIRQPKTYTEDVDLQLPIKLIGGRAQLHYYSGYYQAVFNHYRPAYYKSSSPVMTDLRFSALNLERGMDLCYSLGFIVRTDTRIQPINAATFTKFDPINDTRDVHPGWSNIFTGNTPDKLTTAIRFRAEGEPTVDGDTDLPAGDFDGFVSNYNVESVVGDVYNSKYLNYPASLISDFQPTVNRIEPKIGPGWAEPNTGGTKTYSIAGVAIDSRLSNEIHGGFFFDSPWTFQIPQAPTIFVYGGFYCHYEMHFERS